MSLQLVETAGVSLFYGADAFSAAEGGFETDLLQYRIGVLVESSERVREGSGSHSRHVGYLVLEATDIGSQKGTVIFVTFVGYLGDAVSHIVSVAVVGMILYLPVS